MPNVRSSEGLVEGHEKLKEEWLGRLTALIDSVETWARELGWSTRRIEKAMEDREIGDYKAPSLLLQEEFHRGILEPLDRLTIGSEGVVDLYLMPAWDDIASLFFYDGKWNIHFPDRKSPAVPLSSETLRAVLATMKEHAV